ncbi:hypothetical protein MTO96_041834, partial [Rhipicephalus appendiculatus]
MDESVLYGVNFRYATLADASLQNCDLGHAVLGNADVLVDRAASPRKRVTLSRDEDVIREVTASRTSSSSVQCRAKGSSSSKAWSAPTGKLAVRSALRRLGSGVATKLLAFAERMRSFWIFWRRKHKVGQHRCEEDAHELCENEDYLRPTGLRCSPRKSELLLYSPKRRGPKPRGWKPVQDIDITLRTTEGGVIPKVDTLRVL